MPDLPVRREWLRDGALVVMAALLFCAPRLWAKSLWSPDEARYAEVAREMRASGDYLVPRVYGEPEASYPPLYYWLIALFSLPAGSVTALSASLPSLVAALGLGLATYALGRILWDRRSALLSALLLTSLGGFVGTAILCRADMTMVLLETVALLLFLRWYRSREGARFPMTFYAALAGAVLAKGPQAIIVVIAIIAIFLIVRRELGLIRQVRLVPGLAILVALTLPWYLWAWRATGLDYLLGESLSGFAGTLVAGGHSRRSPLAYVGVVLIRSFPWIFFLPPALAALRREERSDPPGRGSAGSFAFLVAWIAVVLAFYSLAASKRHYYVAAVYPPLALALGRFWARAPEPGGLSLRSLRVPLAALALVALGSELYLDLGPDHLGSFVLTPFRGGLHLLAPAVFLAAVAAWVLAGRAQGRPAVLPVLAGLVLAAHLGSMALYEIPQNLRDAAAGRRFVEALRGAVRPQDELYLFREDVPSIPLHLGRDCRVIADPALLRARPKPPFVVAVKEWTLPEATLLLGPCRAVFRESIPSGGAVLIVLRPD
jgi:4-amino-4-deoxy-L-arabinose transferase-like glycosyltransferase